MNILGLISQLIGIKTLRLTNLTFYKYTHTYTCSEIGRDGQNLSLFGVGNTYM